MDDYHHSVNGTMSANVEAIVSIAGFVMGAMCGSLITWIFMTLRVNTLEDTILGLQQELWKARQGDIGRDMYRNQTAHDPPLDPGSDMKEARRRWQEEQDRQRWEDNGGGQTQ